MEFSTTPVSKKTSKTFSILEILQITVLIGFILYFGKALFIPLSFAMLISFILYPVCKWMEKKGINKNAAVFISIFAIIILLVAIIYLLVVQMVEFSNEWQSFRVKLLETQNQLNFFVTERFGINSEKQLELFQKYMGSFNSKIFPFMQSILYSSSQSIFSLILIIVFSTHILLHRQTLSKVVNRIFPPEKGKPSNEILIETIHAYYNFIKGMLLVYLIVGIFNSIGLAIIGISHPVFFGFTAAMLTFIPYVGITIASLLPMTVSWIEFNSIIYPISVIFVFTVVQFLEAYIIFPYVVGSRLRINTLVIMITIVAGGILWGAAGMILFIPFISIIKLIADRSESLKTLSLLLGDGSLTKKK